ncbi:MAG: hypothetical protein NC926_06305 [Candidatus Omnitrophica bacterium]|nr:hypothetical protein [Candidatus Omnitrophota bacterium]
MKFLIFLSLSSIISFSHIDLSYKWKVLPEEVKFEDIKKEKFIDCSIFLSREYRINNPRIPGKLYWFLFELEKPENTSIPYFIHFKEGPVIKEIYFNGEKIEKYCGKGISRGSGSNWNIFGYWYIIPKNSWKDGKNEVLVNAYDIRFLNDNIFGEVYLGEADLYRLISVKGDFNVESYENWYGYIDIRNISPFKIKLTFSYYPVDYFGVILEKEENREIEILPENSLRIDLPCKNKNTHKFICKFKNDLGEFDYTVYVLPPYKETKTRKIWCLDTPDIKKSYRKYFWEILKHENDTPLEYPPPSNGWQRFPVPNPYREKLEKLHRIWLRTYFDIDKIEKNKKYYLYFESIYEDCEIWINDRKVGEHKGSEIPFYIDITDTIIKGKNEIVLGITGWIANLKPESPKPVLGITKEVGSGSLIRPHWPRDTYYIGITKSVYLEENPQIWIENCLIRTWISKDNLEIIYKIRNDKDKKEEIEIKPYILFEGKIVKEFDKNKVEIEGKSIIEKTFVYKWKPDKLWSPETPYLYQLKVVLLKNGILIDENDFRFGAREWSWEKDKIYLNGKEIKIYEEYAPGLSHSWHTKYSINSSYIFFSTKKALGQFSNRYFYIIAKETIDVADEIGFIVGQEGGLGANGGNHFAYQDERLKENLIKVFKAKIWERGNHPSIILWNTGNECYAPWLAKAEYLDEIEEEIFKIDPTRFVTNDGQYDLEGKAMLANPHYPWYGILPNDAYWYGKADEISDEERERRKRQFEANPDPWSKLEIEDKINTKFTWKRNMPIWIGEFSWIDEQNIPGFYASFWGEDTMTYWPIATWNNWSFGSLTGVSKEREFLYIGYRQCEVNSFHGHCWPTCQPETLSPMAIFPREFSKQFYEGEKVIRNLSIHNDTFEEGDFNVEVKLIERWTDKEYFNEKFNLYLKPFEVKWRRLEIMLPNVEKRKEFIFRLSLYFKDKNVYKKDYIWEIVPRKEIDELKNGLPMVRVYDISGETEKILKILEIKHIKVNDIKELKENDVFIIGQNSLDKKIKENFDHLIELVKNGLTLIILGQNYLGKTEPISLGQFNFKYPANPVYTSTAYPVNYSHPVMKNFDYYDFCFWGENHVVAFEMFDMPSKGNFKPLILTNQQNRSRGLTLPGLIEFILEKGAIYFCQMDLVNKSGKVPASDQLLIQLIKYGRRYEKFGKSFIIIEKENGNLTFSFEHNLGIKNLKKYESLLDLKSEIIFFGDRNESIRKEIENKVDNIIEYIKKGGIIYICDLSEEDKNWFEKLIEGKLEFKLIPTTQVTKINYDPLIDGITNEQLIWAMFSATPIEKRNPNPADIVRKIPLIKTNYFAKPLIYPEGIWKIKIDNGFVIVDNTRWRICNFLSANRLALLLLTNLGIEIKQETKIVEKTDYSKFVSQYKKFFIDLKNFTNWSYIDQPDIPGWIGHGPYRDLRDIPKGSVEFLGIPFYIISPEENDKTIISLYGPDQLVETKEIPVNKNAEILIFLHSSAWVKAEEGETIARYRIRYEKEFIPPEPPPEEVIEVKRGYHVDDWWSIGLKENFKLKEGEVAWEKVFSGHKAGIFLQIWRNPYPDLPIKWIKIESNKNAQFFVFAITVLYK